MAEVATPARSAASRPSLWSRLITSRDCDRSCGARSIARAHRVKRRSRTCVSEAGSAFYSLYGEHTTQTGPRNVNMLRYGRDVRSCQTEGSARSIEWRSAPSARLRTLPNILKDVLESIRSPDKGPVLVHCWNGLHYAGMVSALALRQFCGFSGEQAEAYWRTNANRGASYPLIMANIHNFKPILVCR
jgi:hypothetical protein